VIGESNVCVDTIGYFKPGLAVKVRVERMGSAIIIIAVDFIKFETFNNMKHHSYSRGGKMRSEKWERERHEQ